jgi:hypothetical protein
LGERQLDKLEVTGSSPVAPIGLAKPDLAGQCREEEEVDAR